MALCKHTRPTKSKDPSREVCMCLASSHDAGTDEYTVTFEVHVDTHDKSNAPTLDCTSIQAVDVDEDTFCFVAVYELQEGDLADASSTLTLTHTTAGLEGITGKSYDGDKSTATLHYNDGTDDTTDSVQEQQDDDC